MAGLYGIIRAIQGHQRESFVALLRIPSILSCTTKPSFYKQQHEIYKPSNVSLARRYSTKEQPSSTPVSETEVDIGPGSWMEIYHGVLSTQIKMIKTFSLSTSILGLSMQPFLLSKMVGTHMGVVIGVGSFIGFFTFATPLLIHWVTKKYVTSLEYDQEKDMYSATTLSFFLQEKKVHFSVDDVNVPDVPGMFTTFIVKKKPLFVDPRMFKELEHFGRLMGYDKPIDFHLGDQEKKE